MLDAARDLYAVRPGDFIAARNQLSKQLKADGQPDDAATVAKLRRPRLAEWALNRLTHAEPDLVARFAQAIASAQRAQSAAIGGDAGGLRAATAELRDSLQAVANAAVRGLDVDGGSGEAQRDDLTAILRELVANADPSPLVAGVVGSEAIVATGEFFPGAPVPHPRGPRAGSAPTKAPAAKASVTPIPTHTSTHNPSQAPNQKPTPTLPSQATTKAKATTVPKAKAAAIRAMARAARLDLQQRVDAAAKAVRQADHAVEQAQAALDARRAELTAAQAALGAATGELATFDAAASDSHTS